MAVSAKSLSFLGSAFLVATLALSAAPAFAQAVTPDTAKQAQVTAPAQQAQTETRTVGWQDGTTRYSTTLSMDAEDLARLKADPIEDSVQGQDLVEALQKRGAVLNNTTDANGTIVAAEQEFDLRTGHRTLAGYYKDGREQDPTPGVPAVTHYDAATGNRMIIEHYQAGKLENPAPMIAAIQYFDPAKPEAEPYILLFYTGNKMHDPAPNVPARQFYDITTRKVKQTGHYDHGAFVDAANGEACLQEFDIRTGRLKEAQRYDHGRPQDSKTGDPAWKLFDQSGALIAQKHYQNRLLQDTNGEPAWMQFDGVTGKVIWAERYEKGKSQGVLTVEQLKALNDSRAAAQAPAPVPQTFKP